MRTPLIAAIVLATSAAAAADRTPRVSRGAPYPTEAARLTDAGWKPITLDGSQGCGDGDARCHHRPEVRACAGDAFGPCTFTWLRNDRIVEVATVGAAPARVTGVRCLQACR